MGLLLCLELPLQCSEVTAFPGKLRFRDSSRIRESSPTCASALPSIGASIPTASTICKNQSMHFLECFYLKSSVRRISHRDASSRIEWSDGESERDSCRRDLEKILEKKEKSIKVDDVDVQPACPPGENFAAEVYRVVVYGRRLCLGAWTDIRKSLIVKRVPDPSAPCHRFYDCLRMFQNEVAAYECILPMCQSYLEEKSRSETNELCFPRYYGQRRCFLALQDLRAEGYQQVNRLKGFSARECSLVLREVSKFHALSFALKKDERTLFSKNVDKLQETVFREEHVHDLTGVFWENAAKFAVRSLLESGDPQLSRGAETLRRYSGRILRTLIDLVKPDFREFDVLCHGDLWSNNILLRYCDSGYPIGVKLIDLQAMRYGSCVLDVMHVLFTSSRPVIYERCLDLLLSEYYASLVANLENLEMVPGFTFEEFLAEFKRKIPFGVFLACLMLTCTTRTSSPDPPEENLTVRHLTTESELEKMYGGLSPGYHERLRALFLALTNSNLI